MSKPLSIFKLSIAQSFAVAPIMAIIALIGIAGLGTWSLMQGSSTQERVVEQMNYGVQLTRLQGNLETINADVLQIVTRQAAGESVDVMAEFEAVAASVDVVTSRIEALRGTSVVQGREETLDALVEQLGLYN